MVCPPTVAFLYYATTNALCCKIWHVVFSWTMSNQTPMATNSRTAW
jgi:hypothetical protein